MLSSSTASRFACVFLGLSALGTVLAVASCWTVGWLSDDWVMLARAQAGALFEEARHLALPRRLLWWAAAHGVGPWPFRLVGLGAHLVATLVLLPRIGALMFPAAPPAMVVIAALAVLTSPVAFESLVWPSAVSYPILELELLVVAYAHLRWLRDGGRGWRAGSVLATAAALSTWELGVAAPLVVLILSILAARQARVVRDVAPHLLLLLLWLALKVAFGSVEALEWGEPMRLFGHPLSVPLLLLSPWPIERRWLTVWPGSLLVLVGLALALAAAWRLGRTGVGLLCLTWGVLLPVFTGPGPEGRYLIVAMPWLMLLATAAVATDGASHGRAGRIAFVLAVFVFGTSGAGASWWLAGRWRAADEIARGIVDGIVRAARVDHRLDVVVLDVPDRLPRWGPTSKVPVWRHGLERALAAHGVRLAAQAHTAPADPETLGLRPHTRPWRSEDLRRWRARGLLVLACRPDGRGGYEIVPLAD